jgi:predicted TIM-barrel fold metal-dependent hydrolase
MPKSTLVVDETRIVKSKYPSIDHHFHGGFLRTPAECQKLIAIMDQVGVAMLVNVDGSFGEKFDQYMKASAPYRDRIITFARLDWTGVNEPGWTEKSVKELERCFRAGAQGLKISKELGLDLRNKDGSFIQTDDPRLDPIWDLCAKYSRPVLHHVGDQIGRFLPIGPENERYEAGVWRDDPADNYDGTGQPGYEEIHQHREKMLQKHPKTSYILAHIGMMGFDLKKVGAMLDKYPNAMVDVSAAIQEVDGSRAPRENFSWPIRTGFSWGRMAVPRAWTMWMVSGGRTSGFLKRRTSTSTTRRSCFRRSGLRCTGAGRSTA